MRKLMYTMENIYTKETYETADLAKATKAGDKIKKVYLVENFIERTPEQEAEAQHHREAVDRFIAEKRGW